MKHTLITIFLSISVLLTAQTNYRSKRVKGYSKKNGTYVQPHNRSKSNKTQKDNWSSKPNSNPYTGKKGSKRAKK